MFVSISDDKAFNENSNEVSCITVYMHTYSLFAEFMKNRKITD